MTSTSLSGCILLILTLTFTQIVHCHPHTDDSSTNVTLLDDHLMLNGSESSGDGIVDTDLSNYTNVTVLDDDLMLNTTESEYNATEPYYLNYTTTAAVPQCTTDACQNGGSYCPNSLGVYVCNCTQDYIGDLCEVYDGRSAVADIDPTAADSYTKVGQVMDSLIVTVTNVSNITILNDAASTMSLLIENLASVTWTGEQQATVGTNVIEDSNTILSTLINMCVPSENGNCQEAQKTEDLIGTILNNIVNLDSLIFKDIGVGSFNALTDNINVTVNKATTESLTQSSANDDVVLPSSLVDIVGQKNVIFVLMDINKEVFRHSLNQLNISAAIKSVALITSDTRQSINGLDSDDPLVISVNDTSDDPFIALKLHTDGSTLTAVQEVSLSSSSQVTLVELEIPTTKKLLIRGKFGELPRKYERDFEASVHNEVRNIVTHTHVRSQLNNGQLFLLIESREIQASVVFLVLEYTDNGNSRRRRRSVTNPTLKSRSLDAKIWNPNTLSWDDNSLVQVSGVSTTGKVQFKTNFFGTFAVGQFIIAPTPIDFNRLFIDFATYLQDSPYILAVNCFLLAMTIFIVLFLARLDKSDRELWRYFPLVDNTDMDTHSYGLSVHTSLGSRRKMTATPFFILTGSDGKTNTRILSDGCRKNFRPGTVSNFFVTTNVKLGDVKFIKIWHDNRGDSPEWHIDRIVLVDLQNNTKYLFICHRWLALWEEDGRICRTFKAFTGITAKDFSTLNIMSKLKLFDDHLWLSLLKRPTYSRFTRVQRFLCGIAMVFLSMVAIAMWYQDYDSGTQANSGLKIGSMEFSYRQVYVGIVSSLIIVIPGVLMTLSFKKRKIRGEKDSEEGRCGCLGYITGKKLLPWWFMFVGYFLIVASIGVSVFFTFMYSLQWSGTTSLSWLISLIFCTTGSTAVVEPIKVIILSIVLTAMCKKSVNEDIGVVAPFERETDIKMLSIVPPRKLPEPPDENTEEIKLRRRDLFLKKRLMNVGKSMGIKVAFVALLAVICLHNDVMDSYRLNAFMKTYVNETYLSQSVSKRTDVWTWLDTVFIPALIPKRYYNNQLMSVYDQRFDSDGANIRMGPISLRQFRIKDSCDGNVLTDRYGVPVRCVPDYHSETAQIATFKEGWHACNANGTDCIEKPYKLTSSVGGSTVITVGAFGSYGDGSYIESWDQDQRYAASRKTFLEQNNWLDSSSRALIVEVSLYNPNVGLFNRLQVLFEFPSVGDVTYNVDVKSAKLYPYVNVWDYLVLLLQLGFILTVVFRLCRFLCSACCLREKKSCSSVMVFVLEMILSVLAAVVYGVKIPKTIFVIEELHNNPDTFVSFDLVHLLGDIYRCTISLLLFLRIMFLLEPMTLLQSLFFVKATLSASQKQLWSFALILAVVMTAFASFFYLLEGPTTNDIRSVTTTYMTLFETLVRCSDVEFAVSGIEMHMKRAMFVIFFFFMTVIMVNLAVVILNTDLSAVHGHKNFRAGPNFDQELNDFLWKSIGGLLNRCSPRTTRVSPETTDHSIVTVSDGATEDGMNFESSDTTDNAKQEAIKQEVDVYYTGEKEDKIKTTLDRILLTITNTSKTDTLIAKAIVQTALARLSCVKQPEEQEDTLDIILKTITNPIKTDSLIAKTIALTRLSLKKSVEGVENEIIVVQEKEPVSEEEPPRVTLIAEEADITEEEQVEQSSEQEPPRTKVAEQEPSNKQVGGKVIVVKPKEPFLEISEGANATEEEQHCVKGLEYEPELLERKTKTAKLTLSVNDANGQALLRFNTSDSSSHDVTLGVCDVTEIERKVIERDMRTLYGKVYKCEANYNAQKQLMNIRFHITTERHPYDDVLIAVRSEKARNWTLLKSTYNDVDTHGASPNPIVAVVEASCDYIPEYITCISEPKCYTHTVTPSGGEFSLPFEPKSKFVYQKGCVHSTCDVLIKLLRKHPVPIVQIIPNGNLLCPIKVELPVFSGNGEYGWNPEWVVICSTSPSLWWKVPTQVSIQGQILEFQAYIGPANSKVSFCGKVSEIEGVKRMTGEKSVLGDFLKPETLLTLCDMVGKQWPDLGTALGLQNPHIHMMMVYPHVTTPSDICRHMLATWHKQMPVAVNKVRHLRYALFKIKRQDIIDALDLQERASVSSFSDSVQEAEMIKGFNTIVRHKMLCDSWLRLAEQFGLSQENITQIDCETPRTNPEKTFLVLMKWLQRNPGNTPASLQKVLVKAGFPLVAKNIEGNVPNQWKRQSFSIARRFSRNSFM